MDKSADRMRRASGETEEELQASPSSEKREDNSVTPQLAMEVIIQLETFTGKELTISETELWKRRIQQYPKWKLLKTSEYTGGMTNEYFKFLDTLRREEVNTYLRDFPKSLPAPKDDLGKICRNFMDVLYSEVSSEEKDKAERVWVEEFNSKVRNPRDRVWCQRAGNK